tara:strand:+ start:445 stop:786 length:342 start_codon:yes stop_codon:yes gene_type:complete
LTKQDYSFQLTDQKYHKFLCVKPLLYPHLKIYVLKNKSSGPRITIRVSKKYVKLAVIRNFIKRRLVAAFRDSLCNQDIDVLLIISKKIRSAKNEISDILMQEWKLCINQLKKF